MAIDIIAFDWAWGSDSCPTSTKIFEMTARKFRIKISMKSIISISIIPVDFVAL